MTNPTTQLDDAIHQRVRLGIMLILQEVDKIEFTVLRDELETTDGNVNSHLIALAAAELVKIEKAASGRRKTWIASTKKGRQALTRELELLDAIVQRGSRSTAVRRVDPRPLPA